MYNCIMSQPDTSLPFALNISRSKDYAPRFNIKTHFSSVEFIIIHITHQYAALFSTEFSLVQMISETVHWQSPYFVICMRIKRTTSCIKYFFIGAISMDRCGTIYQRWAQHYILALYIAAILCETPRVASGRHIMNIWYIGGIGSNVLNRIMTAVARFKCKSLLHSIWRQLNTELRSQWDKCQLKIWKCGVDVCLI